MGVGPLWTAFKVIGLLFTIFYRPKFKSSSETPKPGELHVQSSVRGNVIPVVYGKRKLAGNLIWYDNFIVVPHYTETGGGKGGGGGSSVLSHYTYTVSFAFAVCVGPAEVLRIWRGKEEIPAVEWSSLGITTYLGTSDQAVDAHYASFVSRASAYRGICYVMFQNFDLGQASYLPNFQFEISTEFLLEYDRKWAIAPLDPWDLTIYNDEIYVLMDLANAVYVYNLTGSLQRSWGGLTNYPQGGIVAYDGEIYVCDTNAKYVRVYNTTGTLQRSFSTNPDKPLGIAESNGEIYVTTKNTSPNDAEIIVYNTAGSIQRRWGSYGTGNGQMKGPIAITATTARVYVSDTGNNRVQIFDTVGNYISQFAFTNSRGIHVYRDKLYVTGWNTGFSERDLDGNFVRNITSSQGFSRPTGLDVYENELYFTDRLNERIQVLSYLTDVPPPLISEDMLINSFYGLGLASSVIDSTSFAATTTYCENNDLLVSMVIDGAISMSDFLLNLCAHHNGYMTTDTGKIYHKQIESEVISNAIDVDTEVLSKKPPVKVKRDSSRDIRNKIRVKYTKRDDEYSTGVAVAEDEVHQAIYGIKESDVELSGFCTAERGIKIAYSILRRSLDYPMRYSFEVGPKSLSKLGVGEVFAINDSKLGWVNKGLRVMGIEETKNSKVKVNAIKEIDYVLDAMLAPDYDIYTPPATGGDPGNVLYPMVAELPALHTQDKNIVVALYGESGETQWAGAIVKHSFDDTTYKNIETNYGSNLVGSVDSVTADSIVITVSNSSETINSVADIFTLLESLNTNTCFVEDLNIYFRFTTATLISGSQWRLEGIIWDPYLIPTLTHEVEVGHKIGFLTYMLTPVDIEYSIDRKDTTIYFKMVSFNWQGAFEDISLLTPESLAFKATGSRPIAPQNLEVDGYGGLTTFLVGDIPLRWRSCNRLSRGLDYTRSDQISEDTDFVQFNIVVKSGATTLRNVEQAGTTWTYTVAMWQADGSYSSLTFEVIKVCQLHSSLTSSITITLVYRMLPCRVTVLREAVSNLVSRVNAQVFHRDLLCRVTVIYGQASSNLVSRVTVRQIGTGNLVSRVTVFTIPWEFAYESVITAGSQEAGTDVYNSHVDDNNFDHINEVTGVPGFDFYYKHKNVLETCSKSLHVVGYYEGNSAHEVWLYIRNFDLNQWDRVTTAEDDFPDSPSKQIYHFPLPISADYISGTNEMWFRYYHEDSGNPSHDFRIDLHRLSCGFDLVSRVTVTQGILRNKLTCRVTVVYAQGTKNLVSRVTVTS